MAQIYALLAAFLFALSMPLGKLLLGKLAPLELSAFCYLGGALGLFCWRLLSGPSAASARLCRKDYKWVAAFTLFGGVAAPLLLFEGLRLSPSSQASLMLNFELVFTSLIAVVFFRERGGARLWAAVALVTAGAFSLGLDGGAPGAGKGLILVGLASLAWALDNNFTARVSAKGPLTLAAIKGLAGGLFNLALALAVYGPAFLSGTAPAVLALALGAASYGASLVFLILAMRGLGAARAGAFFGVYPFMGALAGLLFLGESLSAGLIAAFVFTAAGAALLAGEWHSHRHFHPALEHEHAHSHDAHHNHHPEEANPPPWHSHIHTHGPLFHEHGHIHDEHHRPGH